MASDEYLWELMMQEAASGALGFEYLNDEPAFVSTSIQNDTPAVPSVGDSINDCILNELFNFSDVPPLYKKEFDTTVLTDIFLDLDSNVNQTNFGLASDEIYTESISLPFVKPEPVASSPQPPYINLPELPSSPVDSEYHTDLPQFVSQSIPVVDSLSSQDVAIISDLPPELLNRLLATISNMPAQDNDNDSISCEDYSMYSGDSTLCSEDDSFEHGEDRDDSREIHIASGVLKVGGRTSDRKQRKMQQNRVAAYRYRQKKKAEQDAIRIDREKLEKRNNTLRTRVHQMKQEIEYLRSLMNDMKKLRAIK